MEFILDPLPPLTHCKKKQLPFCGHNSKKKSLCCQVIKVWSVKTTNTATIWQSVKNTNIIRDNNSWHSKGDAVESGRAQLFDLPGVQEGHHLSDAVFTHYGLGGSAEAFTLLPEPPPRLLEKPKAKKNQRHKLPTTITAVRPTKI